MPPPSRPDRYEDAIRYFRTRVPIRKPAFEELTAKARSRAFTVAGVSQMSMIQKVMDGIDRAIARGETLEQFRRRVLPVLERAWGSEIPGRIETIFRTNLQAAYSIGRHTQLMQPEIRKVLSWWKMDVTLDHRTTQFICKPIAGTVLPAGHPWFLKRIPPLHYRCRTFIRGLRAADVRREGGRTEKPSRKQPMEGFGQLMPLDKWQPDLRRFDSGLVKKYRRKR